MVKRFSWLVVCALLLMFFTFGCGETTRPEKVTAENKADFATESTKTPEVYAVGDCVHSYLLKSVDFILSVTDQQP
jgi:hypothetical protein